MKTILAPWVAASIFLLTAASAQQQLNFAPNKRDDPTYKEALALYQKGDYEQAFKVIKDAPDDRDDDERDLGYLKIRIMMALGQYEEALAKLEKNNDLEPWQQGQMLRHDLLHRMGKLDEAKQIVEGLLGSRSVRRPEDLLALGRAYIMRGAEPKRVLDQFYRLALKADKDSPEPYMAMGELALSKDDSKLAAENFSKGLEKDPKNPDLRCGLARAFFDGDRPGAVQVLEENLKNNPNHVDSLMLMAEHHLLAEVEDKSEVAPFLERVEKVNSRDPRVAAMRSALAVVKANEAEAEHQRAKALKDREQDPEIDFLIGKWLSAQMRFAEAVPYLRQALERDSTYLPASIALGQDLLRLGEEEEAWNILEQVSEKDAYNVEVFNLRSLHDKMQDYQIMNRGNFIVRMHPKEAKLFGDRVLALLEQAERELHPRYGFKPKKPILLEFYPAQEDFAVRTLGFVGGDGLLGACFGLVVTINSPNSPGAKSTNWESTVWHEYCHAVTLGQTKNRIPRWLTEGISVYEERRRDPVCGEQWSLTYRKMVLDGKELIPLNRLNYGFLRPKSGDHMMFAYFEAGMFVEYFLSKYEEEVLREILNDLREGVPFSESCKKRAADLAELEKAFFTYIKDKAKAYGGGLEWEEPEEDLAQIDLEALRKWSAEKPRNYWGLTALAQRLLDQGLAEEAIKPLETLRATFPEGKLAYRLLAQAHQQLKQPEKTREAVWQLSSRDDKALTEMLVILPSELAAKNWDKIKELLRKIMAINPYVIAAQQAQAELYEATKEPSKAIDSYEKVLSLNPTNPSLIHYRLARLFQQDDKKKAKRHVLDALADSPRYQDAQKLLLDLNTTH